MNQYHFTLTFSAKVSIWFLAESNKSIKAPLDRFNVNIRSTLENCWRKYFHHLIRSLNIAGIFPDVQEMLNQKVCYSIYHGRGTKKTSESLTGIKSMNALSTHDGRSNHWTTGRLVTSEVIPGRRGGGLLPIVGYTGRLRPKGVFFYAAVYKRVGVPFW